MEQITEKNIIKTLFNNILKIQNNITKIDENIKNKFISKTLILWEKSGKLIDNNFQYNFKRTSSYIILNQLLFYYLLQKKNKEYNKTLPELEPLINIEDPNLFYINYIQKLIEKIDNYKYIFEINLFEILPKTKNLVNSINDAIKSIISIKLELQNSDVIGKVFHDIIPFSIRKQLAAYYTSNSSAKLLANLSIEKKSDKICDLACGSGTLLVESYHVLKKLYDFSNEEKLSNEEIHEKILENQIYGNDIVLFSTYLAAMNLIIQSFETKIIKINLTSMNGLSISPKNKRLNLMDYIDNKEYNIIGIKNKKKSIFFDFVDIMIMNPPFSRRENMSEKEFKYLNNITLSWFGSKKLRDKYVDKSMGLHGYFILHSDHFLKRNGKIAMILPSSTFATNYGKKILNFLKDKKYSIEYIIEKASDNSTMTFSESAEFKEYIVIFKKGNLTKNSQTLLISILKNFDDNNVYDVLNEIKFEKYQYKYICKKKMPTYKIYESSKWSKLFLIKDFEFTFEKSKKLEFYKNNDGIKIKSGFRFMYLNYLIIPNNEWEISKEINNVIYLRCKSDEKIVCTIPKKYLIKIANKTKHINKLIFEPNSYALNLPPILPNDLLEFKANYLDRIEKSLNEIIIKNKKKGIKRFELCKDPKSKSLWYSNIYHAKVSGSKANLFHNVKYNIIPHKVIAFYSNEKVTSSDNIHQCYTKNDKLYASYMSSSIYLYFLWQNHQIIKKNFFKMQIKDFDEIKFPKLKYFVNEINQLTNKSKDLILKWKNMAKLKDSELPTIPIQLGINIKNPNEKILPLKERVELDNAWLKSLGVPENKINEEREKLYDWLKKYILKYV